MMKSMLDHIRLVPLAAESLGVRSMCTYVETPDARILLDAGVSLCPNRFGLPPHPQEFKAIAGCRERIAEFAARCEVVTLSHYHFDHHTPSYEDWLSQWTEADETARQLYDGKLVLVKNPRESINYSQRRRGWLFQDTGGRYARKIEVADGQTFTFNDTLVKFSRPVFHGSEDSALGWVLMTTIDWRGEKFMFAPDVQGPISTLALEIIMNENPELLLLGGPPTYLAGFRVDERQIKAGFENLQALAGRIPTIVLEHHILRDENWKEKSAGVFCRASESGHTVVTAAQFLGLSDSFLEARRKKLFKEDPPSKEFQKWMRINPEAKRLAKPPI
jgi:predicted metallo-beta-lactamase superfamily hydrolase